MAAPKAQWGALNWTLNLEKLVSTWKRAINRLAKRPSGRLARSLRLRNVRGTMKSRIVLSLLALPYARIQDMGGQIPDRRARNRKVMRFHGSRDGKLLFRRRVKGFRLKGLGWVAAGFEDFWRRGRYRAHERPATVAWKGKGDGRRRDERGRFI